MSCPSAGKLCHSDRLENCVMPIGWKIVSFRSAGKLCCAHGLRQLKRNVKSEVGILNFRSGFIHTHEKHEEQSENVVLRLKISKIREMTIDNS